MRRLSVVPILLAAVCLTSTAALAAMPAKGTANFQSLASSGVNGTATLREVATGGTLIHADIRGLQPGVDYVIGLFPASQGCTAGAPAQQVVRVTANPAGNITFNQKVTQPLSAIGSLSVQLASDFSLQACGTVVVQ